MRRYLRCLTFHDRHPCSANAKAGCHTKVWLEECPAERNEEGVYLVIALDRYAGDTRWPAVCDQCKQPFPPDAYREIGQEPIYRSDTGECWLKQDLPPGAMYNAPWYAPDWVGPDGLSLVVILPDGVAWAMDCPSSNGTPWKRTGVAPMITATPSIRTQGYHGHLRSGVLVPV